MKSFNALIVRFGNEAAYAAIKKLMEDVSFDFITTITSERCMYDKVAEDKQPWFASSFVRGCQYDGVDFNELDPVDEELIEQMRDCEAIFMHMVSRTEVARLVPYAERKRQYLKHLRFWNDYLDRHNINLFISAWMPHEVPDYIIYRLCKLKGIPTLVFHITSLKNYMYVMTDVLEYDPKLGIRYKELLKECEGKSDAEIELCQQFEEYIQGQSTEGGKMPFTEWPKPPNILLRWARIFMNNPVGTTVFVVKFFLGFLSIPKWKRRFQRWQGNRTVKMLSDFYHSNAITPDLHKKFIYIPLHYQPEATTCPMAGGFCDQLLIVQLLSKCLPDDVLLYVKEHPKQTARGSACRNIQYYKDLLAIKNVRLVDTAVDSFELREHCSAIATSAGTAGFEAIFRGKPVFMFGHYFYQYAPGVYPIHSEEDCRKAAEEVFAEGKKPTLHECRVFLKAVEETAVRSALCNHHQMVCDLSTEEIAHNTAELLVQEIGKL